MEEIFNNEIYLFLGTYTNIHFFFHVIFSDKFESTISYEIYNVLIDNKFIENNNEIVIIYEFNMKQNEVNIILIQHKNSEKYVTFDKNNLENIYPKLIDYDTRKNKKSYVIKYYYNQKIYGSICVDDFPQLSNDDDKKNININTIYEVLTTKKINN